jgi:conserved oligomeric Golgi complex subunit 8
MEEPVSSSTPTASSYVDASLLADVIASSLTVSPEQLRRANCQSYLSKITTFGLQELLAEPTVLQTQSHHLTSSLTTLTHTSYPTFLSLHHTTNALTSSLTSLSSSLDSLLTTSLPALEESAAGWKDRTETVLNDRNKARVVLEQHEKIRDLLDIPILIDTCVRNGYFAEALSLASHAKSLAGNASLSSKSPPLILSSVLSEVHHSIMQMLLSLIATLYEPNRKLPALWKAINFLRKMDVFGPSSPFASAPPQAKLSVLPLDPEKPLDFIADNISNEEQIALAFLVGRESCLKVTLEACGSDISRLTQHNELDDREKEDLARYLKRYIDLWREGVYDIVTQYSTIFLEKPPGSSTPQQSPIKSTIDAGQPAISLEVTRLHTLITTYASRTLTAHLLPLVSPCLPLLSLPLLPSLLTQLTYCSTAFARVGLDFRGILSLLFSHAVAEVVSHEFRTVGDKFVSKFQDLSTPKDSDTKKFLLEPSKWLVTPAALLSPPVPNSPSSPTFSPSSTGSAPHIPPHIIASYPPLAEHTNSLLGVLNNLRLLAPTNILHTLVRVLDDDVLGKGGEAVIKYIKAVFSDKMSNGTISQEAAVIDTHEKEDTVAMSTGHVYFSVFVPFMRRALVEGVYGTPLDSHFDRGEGTLPSVVMDWEDFVLEQEA